MLHCLFCKMIPLFEDLNNVRLLTADTDKMPFCCFSHQWRKISCIWQAGCVQIMLQDITFLGHSSRQKAPPVVWDRQAASRTEIVFWFQFRFYILRLLIWGQRAPPLGIMSFSIMKIKKLFHAPKVVNMFRGPNFSGNWYFHEFLASSTIRHWSNWRMIDFLTSNVVNNKITFKVLLLLLSSCRFNIGELKIGRTLH